MGITTDISVWPAMQLGMSLEISNWWYKVRVYNHVIIIIFSTGCFSLETKEAYFFGVLLRLV